MSDLHPCGYYGDRDSRFYYFFIKGCTSYFYRGLLERGYRRFGEFYFVPRCIGCRECITIRQLIREFYPSASMKRVLRKNLDTYVHIRKPVADATRVSLYDKYHAVMTSKRGWVDNRIDLRRYAETFVEGSVDFGYEMCFHRDNKLVGVSYFDIVENSMSAIYFFYDHDYSSYSLGTLNMLLLLGLGFKCGLEYLYPGHWIDGHGSMDYKRRFKPFEALLNDADIFDQTVWKRYD